MNDDKSLASSRDLMAKFCDPFSQRALQRLFPVTNSSIMQRPDSRDQTRVLETAPEENV